MSFTNAMWIVLIIIIAGVIAFLYYYAINKPTTVIKKKIPKNIPKKKSKKRVRFNSDVDYKTFTKDSVSVSNKPLNASSSKRLRSPVLPKKHVSNSSETSIKSETSNTSETFSDQSFIDLSDYEPEIIASNYTKSDENDQWDSTFGVPLADKNMTTKFRKQLESEHNDYTKSLGSFAKYQTDDSTLIKTDTTIDIFDSRNKDKLKGKTIAEIYDQQVAGPKIISKKPIGIVDGITAYENENPMNGKSVLGSGLSSYNSGNNMVNASFGNDF